MKAKGKKNYRNKYTNAPKYEHRVIIRLDNYQHLFLDELCSKYNTTKSAILRLALNQFIKDTNNNEE